MSGCAGRSWCENYTQSAPLPRRKRVPRARCMHRVRGRLMSSPPSPALMFRTRCPRPRHPLNLPPAENRRRLRTRAVSRDYEPVPGQWYENLEEEESFRVLTVDEDSELVEI